MADGERLSRFCTDPDQWEMHRYRYEFANRAVGDDDIVVDAACGIGYGRDILRGEWIGVDREPPPAALTVDLNTWEPAFDFDVFVGLETIEHLDDFTAYVAAAKRARHSIILSTPIIPTKHMNCFHLHDFTRESVEALFSPWRVWKFEAQADPKLGPDVYGLWWFVR